VDLGVCGVRGLLRWVYFGKNLANSFWVRNVAGLAGYITVELTNE